MPRICLLLALAAGVGTVAVAAVPVTWDGSLFSEVPQVWEATDYATNGMRTVFYENVPYRGNPTRVFAYLGVPKSKDGKPLPGMVLVHGGGGSAFYRWVRYWNGYVTEHSMWKDVERFKVFGGCSAETLAKYDALWDPKRYLPSATMPFLFIDSTNDRAYPVDGNLLSREDAARPHGHVRRGPDAAARQGHGAPLQPRADPGEHPQRRRRHGDAERRADALRLVAFHQPFVLEQQHGGYWNGRLFGLDLQAGLAGRRQDLAGRAGGDDPERRGAQHHERFLPAAEGRTTGGLLPEEGRVVRLASGRIVIPVALHHHNPRWKEEKMWCDFDPYGKVGCVWSDDEGVTWNFPKEFRPAVGADGLLSVRAGT